MSASCCYCCCIRDVYSPRTSAAQSNLIETARCSPLFSVHTLKSWGGARFLFNEPPTRARFPSGLRRSRQNPPQTQRTTDNIWELIIEWFGFDGKRVRARASWRYGNQNASVRRTWYMYIDRSIDWEKISRTHHHHHTPQWIVMLLLTCFTHVYVFHCHFIPVDPIYWRFGALSVESWPWKCVCFFFSCSRSLCALCRGGQTFPQIIVINHPALNRLYPPTSTRSKLPRPRRARLATLSLKRRSRTDLCKLYYFHVHVLPLSPCLAAWLCLSLHTPAYTRLSMQSMYTRRNAWFPALSMRRLSDWLWRISGM